MIEYIIVSCDEDDDIAELVNEKISNGYVPQGGIAVRHGSTRGARYIQAMVKNNE